MRKFVVNPGPVEVSSRSPLLKKVEIPEVEKD